MTNVRKTFDGSIGDIVMKNWREMGQLKKTRISKASEAATGDVL